MARTGARHYKKMKALNPSQLGPLRAQQWTQEEFSEKTSLSVNRISEAETGKVIPGRCAQIYAGGLNRSVEDLFSYVHAGVASQSERASIPSSSLKEENVGVADHHPETRDSQWMEFLTKLSWQEPYHVTECAWVYRFPGVGVDSIKLSYNGQGRSSRYDPMLTPIRKAAERWHHPEAEKEGLIRGEEWGLQVRLERVESSH